MNFNDWLPYLDQYGLVQPEPGTTSDNGVRFTTETILALQGQPGIHAKLLFKSIELCQVEPGLLQRYPGCKKQDSFDNYIAACAASYLCDNGLLARRIYEYGLRHFGFYNNSGYSWSGFLWRNPSLVSFAKFCAYGSVGPLGQFILAKSIDIAARSKEQDSKILSWFMVRCLADSVEKFSYLDMTIAFWVDELRNEFPHGIGEVLGKYYHPKHFDHPNSKALMNVYS